MPPNRVERNRKPHNNAAEKLFNPSSWNTQHVKLLLIFTLIGTYARIEPALFDSVHFSYDQGVDISYVRDLVENHRIRLIGRFTGLEGVFMGPLWTWILAIPYLISGGNPTANVLFLSVLGILAIWYTYGIVARIVNERAALISAFYVAISGPFISASHVVISPSPLTILEIFHLWLLWEIIYRKKERLIPWIGLLIGIFFQLEIGYAAFLTLATLVTLILIGDRRFLLRREAFIGLLIFISTFLPQILFDLRHDFLITNSLFRYLSGQNTSLGSQGANFLERLPIRLGSLWEDYTSSTAFEGKNAITGALVSLPAIAGWFSIVRNKEKKQLQFGKMLLLLIFSTYAGFTIFPAPVWVWYRAGLPILFILLVAIGWDKLIQERKELQWVIVVFFAVIFAVMIAPQSLTVKAAREYEGGPATLRNQKRALNLVFQNAQNQEFDLYVYTPPIYTYVWDHMLYWYAQPRFANFPEEYGYQRSQSAENDFYLIIEPDEEYEVRIDGWKGNFEGEGIPQNTWHLPGAITVEKWKSQNQQTNESNQ